MKTIFNNYIENNFIVFSVDIKQELNKKENVYKKKMTIGAGWNNYTLDNTYFNEKYNSLALLTGEKNNIFVLDIDNILQWGDFLKENKQTEPDTVKVITGSGGYHYYFKYTDRLKNIKNCSKIIDDYDFDVRTNGGCIIIPPSSYLNKISNTKVFYSWCDNNDIFNSVLNEVPEWLLLKMLKKYNTESLIKIRKKKMVMIKENIYSEEEDKEKVNENKDKDNEDIIINLDNIENTKMLKYNFTDVDIELLLDLLSQKRLDDYTNWIEVGMCLHNINKHEYLYLWKKWSRNSVKYENGICETKWKTFKSMDQGINIGSLLRWCENDNKDKYKIFIENKQINNLIVNKFPTEKLIIGNTIKVNSCCKYITLNNNKCLIKGEEHEKLDKSMYIELFNNKMAIKCRDISCFGEVYPCEHIILSTIEAKIFCDNINIININSEMATNGIIDYVPFSIFENEEIDKIVYDSLNGKESSYAKIIYFYYQDKYIYDEGLEWHEFKNHKWHFIGKHNYMTQFKYDLENKLVEIYNKVITYYDKNRIGKKEHIFGLQKIKKEFGDTILKDKILKEAAIFFSVNKNSDKNFLQKLNKNKHLICFNNGVYDLQNNLFRDGKPDDYLSIGTNYDYKKEYTNKKENLLKFLKDILPDNDILEYFLTLISSSLINNVLELFTILIGSTGRNGKSKMIDLIKLVLGDYCATIQGNFLLKNKNNNIETPSPILLSLRHKKLVFISEIDASNELDIGFIKKITGVDSSTHRYLFQNDTIDFTPEFTLILACNTIPKVNLNDVAFVKRLRCINFLTEFTDEVKKENEKLRNNEIKKEFDGWKTDFMLMLIEHYNKFSNNNKKLETIDKIVKSTNKYIVSNDVYSYFLESMTKQSNKNIHCIKIYDCFKSWMLLKFPEIKIVSEVKFYEELRKKYTVDKIKINNNKQLGIKNLELKTIFE